MIGQSADIIMQPEDKVRDINEEHQKLTHGTCGLLAAKQPGETPTVEVMLRKANTIIHFSIGE